jgi:tetratricopeptide (TPR) repeat protein
MLAGLLFALVGERAITDENNNPKNFTDSDKNIIAVCILIPFLICWIFFSYLPARKSKLYAETFRLLVSQTPKDYQKLIQGSPVGKDWDVSGIAYDAYRLYVENAKKIKNDEVLRESAIKNVDGLLDYLYTILDTNKTDYRLYVTIIYLENTKIYFSDQQYDAKKKDQLLGILEQARKLSPNNPNVYWNIAQVKIWAGDFVGAEESYRQGIIVAPHLPGSYTLYMTYAQAIGNNKLFNELTIQAQKNVPGFNFN